MANWYVYSGAAGANTGADWTNAYTNLSSISGKAAGDIFYVAHDHAQTQASNLTITSPGTEASPSRIYCVNRSGSVPPVSADLRTTATVTTTGAFSITLDGTVSECYGITFSCSSGATGANMTIMSNNRRTWRLVNCSLQCGGTGATNKINFATGLDTVVIMENVTFKFNAAGQGLDFTNRCYWRNTPSAIVGGGTIPTTLFTSCTGLLFIEGVDLSSVNTTLVVSSLNTDFTLVMKDCKLHASVAVQDASTFLNAQDITLIRCDSGDTNYRTERHNYFAVQTTETTIVRTGGATDGTTPIAWKIITSASTEKELPYESLPISIWNETTGSAITVTLQGIWGSGSVPNNDDIWIDVQYLGTSGYPLSSKATCGKADSLASGAGLAAGSGTWGGSTTKFAMAATFTPQEKGPLTIYIKAALASTTFYIDPKPVIT
jgi:hypothetical protein